MRKSSPKWRGDDSKLSDLGVRLSGRWKEDKLTPTKPTARGKMTRRGGVGQTEKRLSVLLVVLRLMLRNMPGGLDGAPPLPERADGTCGAPAERIRAACILTC